MKVKLLSYGCYSELEFFRSDVVINAEPSYGMDGSLDGFDIHEDELEKAGFEGNDGLILFFLPSEIEIVSQ